MSTTPLRDIFGKPNTGVHQHRWAGLAAVDLLATAAVAVALALVLAAAPRFPPAGDGPSAAALRVAAAAAVYFAGLMALSVAVHVAVGVRTALVVALGLLPPP